MNIALRRRVRVDSCTEFKTVAATENRDGHSPSNMSSVIIKADSAAGNILEITPLRLNTTFSVGKEQ